MSTTAEEINIEKSPKKSKIESPKKNEIINHNTDGENFQKIPNEPFEKIRGYSIIREIGQGTFGLVYLAEKETNKKLYALKVIKKEFLSITECSEEAFIERIILSKCKHPSIVRLSSSFQNKSSLFFVMDYCPNKDLNELIHKFGTLEPDLAFQIICELVNVIDYLHNDMNITHNDLKPSNILLP